MKTYLYIHGGLVGGHFKRAIEEYVSLPKDTFKMRKHYDEYYVIKDILKVVVTLEDLLKLSQVVDVRLVAGDIHLVEE